jgi:DNA invertase Pin-like site-specific DNA recombinase
VSTTEQGTSGLGMAGQLAAIEAACKARGLELVGDFTDVASGAKDDRPGLAEALAAVGPGRSAVLVVSRQDRLSRSLFHLASLIKQADSEGWALVIADTGLDTSTTNGRLMAGILGSLAQWEREQISARTVDALKAAQQKGTKLGRKPKVTTEVRARITELRAEGLSWAKITEALKDEECPTGHGGDWHPTQVRRIWLAEQAAA